MCNFIHRLTVKAMVFAALLLFCSALSYGQQVIGVSAILNSTSSSQIDTYSATELDAAAAYYYDAGVDGYLFQNGSLIAWSSVNAGQYAYRYMSKPLQVGNIYQLESDHWLVQYFAYYYNGYNWYSNPYGFGYACGSCGGGYPSGYGFAPSGGPAYYSTQDIYLGTTAVAISSAAPNITNLNPGGASRGASGSVTLQGTNLMDLWTQTTTPAISGSGVSVSVQSASSSQVVLGYTVASNASTGAHNITVATRFGTSNSVAFNVGDRTPVVQSVSPSTWPAGTNTTVTLTGTGFGTNPTVSASGTGVSISVTNANDTQITATVSVTANAPDQTSTVQVQSNGYTGSGFIATTGGQSSTGSNTATVQAIAAPVPQIVFQGSNIAGTTKSVVIGQQIALSRAITLPAGLNVQSESWSVPPGTANGGVNFSTSNGSEIPLPGRTSSTFTYYWVTSGNSRQMTYTYTLDNGKSNSASTTFNVAGPTGVNVGTYPNSNTMAPVKVRISSFTSTSGATVNAPALRLGDGNPADPAGYGIVLQATGTLPSNPGTYTWVQLLNTDHVEYLDTAGVKKSCVIPGSNPLDNVYPYSSGAANSSAGFLTGDSPATPLAYKELAQTFIATMYLLWDPTLDAMGQSTCSAASVTQAGVPTPSNCASIPVPIGSIGWKWKGDVIDTLQAQSNGTDYTLSCGTKAPSGWVSSSSYPVWQSVTPNVPISQWSCSIIP